MNRNLEFHPVDLQPALEVVPHNTRIMIGDIDITVMKTASACEKENNPNFAKRTFDIMMEKWLQACQADCYVGYLTDSPSNFRRKRAVTWPYKGQRTPERPKYYDMLRKHAQDKWGVQMIYGMEADDALAIAQKHFYKQGYTPIIATGDKDLQQVPGLHVNIYKLDEGVFRVSPLEAYRNLWAQVITGDGCDNIPGVSHAITETTVGAHNRRVQEDESLTVKERKAQYKKYSNHCLYGAETARGYLEGYPVEKYKAKRTEYLGPWMCKALDAFTVPMDEYKQVDFEALKAMMSQVPLYQWNKYAKKTEVPTRSSFIKQHPMSGYEVCEWPMRVLELYIDCYEWDDEDFGRGEERFYETFDLIFMLRDQPKGESFSTVALTPINWEAPERIEDMFEDF